MSDAPDIRINVGIDGQGTKPELDDIAKGAREAGAAGAGAGNKLEEAGDKAEHGGKRGARGAKEGAEGLADFHRKAETLVKGIVGEFNPALSQSMDMMFDFAEGAHLVTAQLLAWGAAGLIIGGITAAVSALADEQKRLAAETERVNDALRKQRDMSVDASMGWADRLNKVGLPTGPADIQSARSAENELNARGTVDEMARNAIIAQRIGGLSDAQREQYLAGIVAGGGKPVEFKGDPDADRKTIEKVMAAGAGEEAQRRLAQRRSADMEGARRQMESKPERDAQGEAFDTELQRWLDAHPGIDPKNLTGADRDAIWRLTQGTSRIGMLPYMRAGDVLGGNYGNWDEVRVDGGNVGMKWLEDIARDVKEQMGQRSQATSGGGQMQVTVYQENVTNKYEFKSPNAAPPVQLDVFNGVGGQ